MRLVVGIAVLSMLPLLGGCAMTRDETLQATSTELAAVLDDVVAATDLPVTRRREAPGLFLSCDDGTERLAAKVNADDPPELEPLARSVVAHLESQGWERTGDLPVEGRAGASMSVFLTRDGFDAIVDVVRGADGSGVDVEVLSPCSEMDGPG
jgi:hypothetical protein